MKFKIDEWVYYYPFRDSDFPTLSVQKDRAVILEVLDSKDLYDYRIYIDDGSSKTKKVKEENLELVEQN